MERRSNMPTAYNNLATEQHKLMIPQDTPTTQSARLLKQHRAIARKQLVAIAKTIQEIDVLLTPHDNLHPKTFAIKDKVISLSAPNKNRVGLVTKVTSFFIHVQPINAKYPRFKKDPQNIAHHSLLSVAVSLQPASLPA